MKAGGGFVLKAEQDRNPAWIAAAGRFGMFMNVTMWNMKVHESEILQPADGSQIVREGTFGAGGNEKNAGDHDRSNG
jgi:hypothetical protein